MAEIFRKKTAVMSLRKCAAFRTIALGLAMVMLYQSVASAIDYSSLSYNEKNYVEKQGFSAQEFIKQMQMDQEYLRRQYTVAQTLNHGVASAEADLMRNLFGIDYDRMKTAQELEQELLKAEGVFKRAGSGVSGFNYTEHQNGKVVWTKNGLAEKVLNDPVKNKNGTVTIRNTYNMTYDKRRLLTDYDAEILDPRGNTTFVHWHGGSYTKDSKFYADETTNANKHLTYYEESIVDGASGNTTKRVFKDPIYKGKNMVQFTEVLTDSRSPDKITEKVRHSITYDGDHNTKSYLEDITEKIISREGQLFTRTFKKEFKDARYDGDKNLLHSVEIVHDEYGSLRTEFDGEYSELGELVRSTKIQSLGDLSIRTDFIGTYDDHFQLMESSETITDSRNPEKKIVRKFKAGLGEDYGYNNLGDMTSYTEEWTDGSGKTITRRWFDAQYTKQRQIAAYKEEIVDELGNQLNKEWKIKDFENGYDRLNQVKAFEETTVFENRSYKRDVSNIRHDSLNQMSVYDEVYTIVSDDIDYKKTTKRDQADYHSTGELKAYSEESTEYALDASKNIILDFKTETFRTNMSTKAYHEERRIIADGIDHKIVTDRSGIVYSPNKVMAEYRDRMVDSGSPDAYTEIHRSKMHFGMMNRIYGYEETVFNSATPGSGSDNTKRTVSNCSYDLMNRLLSKEEKVTTITGLEYKSRQEDIKYNALGQELSYLKTEIKHSVKVDKEGQKQSADITSFTQRTLSEYDLVGQLDFYQQETKTDIDGLVRESTWIANEFNQHSQVRSYTDTTRTYDEETDGELTDFTQEITRSNISYQSLDLEGAKKLIGLQGSYDERILSTSAEDLVVEKQMRDIAYDSYGHNAGYVERKHDYHKTDKNILDNVVRTTRSATVYNQNFELESYQDFVEQLGDGDGNELYVATTVVRSDIVYDVFDRMLSYNETSNSSADPARTRDTAWQADEFDHNNQVIAFSQTVTELGEGLDKSSTMKRFNIKFNGANQMAAYEEEASSDAAQDKVIKTKREEIVYNTLNQTDSYKDNINEESLIGKFSTSSTIERNSSSYNRFALLSDYVQTVNSSISPDMITKISMAGAIFNRNAQMISFTQLEESSADDGSLDTKVTTNKSNIAYNQLGQMSDYDEDRITEFLASAEADDLKSYSMRDINYDSKDRQFSFVQENIIEDTAFRTKRTETKYNDFGLILSNKELSEREDANGLFFSVEKQWQAESFNTKTQLSSFSQLETGNANDENGNNLAINREFLRTNIEYNDLNQNTAYQEKGSSYGSGEYEKDYLVNSFDKSGRVRSLAEAGYSSASGPYGFIRTNISYNTFLGNNLVAGYQESGNSSGLMYEKNWTANDYDVYSHLLSYSETGYDSSRGTYASQRTDLAYNRLDQLLSFEEIITNAAGGQSHVSREETSYDEKGRVFGFRQRSRDAGGNETQTDRQTTSYNELAQILEYEQNDRLLDSGSNLVQITKTKWTSDSESYNDLGINTKYTNHKTVSDEEHDPNWSIETTTVWEGLEYNDDWKQVSYKESTELRGNTAVEEALDNLTQEQKDAYLANANANSFSSRTETLRSNIAYDEKGRLNSYHDEMSTQGLADKTITDWSGAQYDANGLMIAYKQKTQTDSIIHEIERTDINYDLNNRISSYLEKDDDGTFELTTKMTDIIYDAAGRQYSFVRATRKYADDGANVYDVTNTTVRQSSEYADNFVTAYEETSSNSDEDFDTNTKISGIIYTERANQLASIVETTKTGETEIAAYTDASGNELSDTRLKELLDVDPLKSLSDLIAEGAIKLNSQTKVLSTKSYTVRSNQVYDQSNDMVSSDDYTLTDFDGALTHTREEKVVYDEKHRRISFENISTKTTADGSINKVTQTSRENINYNSFDQIVAYDDITKNGAEVFKTNVTDISYDANNKEESRNYDTYRKDILEDDTKYFLLSQTERIEQEYNLFGQLASYTDRTTEKQAFDKQTVREDKIELFYNSNGLSDSQLTRSKLLNVADPIESVMFRFDINYNANGQISNYIDISSRQGEASYAITKTTDIVYNKFEQQTESQSVSESYSADQSFSKNTTTAKKDYDLEGRLLAVSDGIVTYSEDGFGYEANSSGTNDYVIINGQAKLSQSTSNGTYSTLDKSSGTTVSTVNYEYTEHGYLKAANGSSVKDHTDTYGNKNHSETTDTYEILNGQAMIKESLTESAVNNIDGSSSSSTSSVEYEYRENGSILSASGTAVSDSDDGFKNKTHNETTQVYTIINNKAKVIESISNSSSNNFDASSSSQTMTTSYEYDAKGLLLAAQGKGNSSSDDGYANKTETEITQNYQIVQNQALLTEAVNISERKDRDKSSSHSEMITTYTYNEFNQMSGASSSGESVSNDGYGNISNTLTTQSFQIIAGQARVNQALSETTSTNKDGSSSNSASVSNYTYKANGTLESASGSSSSESDDGYGNKTKSNTANTYAVINNQAKVIKAISKTASENLDGTASFTENIQTSDYESNGRTKEVKAISETYSYEADPDSKPSTSFEELELIYSDIDNYDYSVFYNLSKSSQNQTFVILAGKQKLSQSKSTANNYNADGASSNSVSEVNYEYDLAENGILIDANGMSSTDSDDGWGNTSHAEAEQTYELINGQAKLVKTVTNSDATNLDGSSSNSTNTMVNTYDANGKLLNTGARVITESNDGFDNTTSTDAQQIYVIINGRSKLKESRSVSDTNNFDQSTSHSEMTTLYDYDSRGVTTNVSASGSSSSSDGFGYDTSSTITQNYKKIKGQWKVHENTTVSLAQRSSDAMDTETRTSLKYDYDLNGKLNDVSALESSTGLDGQGNTFSSTSTKEYFLQYGQMRQESVVTDKKVVARDGAWTKDVHDEWQAAETQYNANGKLISYTQTTSELGTGGNLLGLDMVMTTSQEIDSYTEQGAWIKAYTRKVTTVDNNGDLNKWVETQRTNDKFDEYGRVLGYTDKSCSSDAQDKISSNVITDIEYNEYSQDINHNFEFKQSGSSDDIDFDGQILEQKLETVVSGNKLSEYDEYGLATKTTEILIDEDKQTTTISENVYDDLARVISSTKTSQERAINGELVLSKSSTLSKDNYKYNVLGQALEWTELRSSSEAKALESELLVKATYNNLGQMASYEEAGQKRSTDPSLVYSETVKLEKNSIVYNELGQTSSWEELSSSSASPGKEIKTKVSAVYFEDGKMKSTIREINETIYDGANLIQENSYTAKTNMLAYNGLGQVSRKETWNLNEDGSSTYVKDVADIEYNQEGQVFKTQEEVVEDLELGLKRSFNKTIDKREYNDLGQLISRAEKVLEGDKISQKTTAVGDVNRYDELGRLIYTHDYINELAYDDHGNAVLDNKTATKLEFVYDAYGRTSSQLISNYKVKDAAVRARARAALEYEEISRMVQENNDYDSQGRVVKYTVYEKNSEDVLVSKKVVSTENFNDFGKAVVQLTENYGFGEDGFVLLDSQRKTVNAFDSWGNEVDCDYEIVLESVEQELAIKNVKREYNEINQLFKEREELSLDSLGIFVKEKELINFNSEGQAGNIKTNQSKFDSDNVLLWQTEASTSMSFDSYGNILNSETTTVDNDGQLSHETLENKYENINAQLKGNFTESVKQHKDATNRIIKEVLIENEIDAQGNVSSYDRSEKILVDDVLKLVRTEHVDNIELDSNGKGKLSQVESKTYYDNLEPKTDFSKREVLASNFQGQVLAQRNYDYTKNPSDGGLLIKYNDTYTNTSSLGTVISTRNFLPKQGDMLKDRELTTDTIWQLVTNARGESVASILLSQNSDDTIRSKKEIEYEYDSFSNVSKQNTRLFSFSDENKFVQEFMVEKTNTDFNEFGDVISSETVTSKYDSADYITLNKVSSDILGIDSQGRTVSKETQTSVWKNGDWNLVFQNEQNNEYGDLENKQTIIKKDSTGTKLSTTVVIEKDLDDFDNAQEKLVSSTTHNESGVDYEKLVIKDAIVSNSIGWEIEYNELIENDQANPDIVTNKEFRDGYYDDGGMLFSYQDKTVRQSLGADYISTSIIDRLESYYDVMGSIKSYKQDKLIEEGQPKDFIKYLQHEERSDIEYDALNQTAYYVDTISKEYFDGTIDESYTVETFGVNEKGERSLPEYDLMGRIVSSNKQIKTVYPDGASVMTNRSTDYSINVDFKYEESIVHNAPEEGQRFIILTTLEEGPQGDIEKKYVAINSEVTGFTQALVMDFYEANGRYYLKANSHDHADIEVNYSTEDVVIEETAEDGTVREHTITYEYITFDLEEDENIFHRQSFTGDIEASPLTVAGKKVIKSGENEILLDGKPINGWHKDGSAIYKIIEPGEMNAYLEFDDATQTVIDKFSKVDTEKVGIDVSFESIKPQLPAQMTAQVRVDHLDYYLNDGDAIRYDFVGLDDVKYDDFGRQLSYKRTSGEIDIDQGSLFNKSVTEHTVTSFDEQGRELESEDTVSNYNAHEGADYIVNERIRTENVVYNSAGRKTSYTTVKSADYPAGLTTTTRFDEIKYYESGKQEKADKTVTNIYEPQIEYIWDGIINYGEGSVVDLNGDGVNEKLSKYRDTKGHYWITSIDQHNYGSFGRQIFLFATTAGDNSNYNWGFRDIDSDGQLDLVVYEKANKNKYSIYLNTGYSFAAPAAAWTDKSVITTDSYEYDNLGRTKYYKETTQKKTKNGSGQDVNLGIPSVRHYGARVGYNASKKLWDLSKVNKEVIHYDSQNRVLRYTESTITKANKGSYKTVAQIEYDADGNRSSYVEYGRREDTFCYDYTRSNIKYDQYRRMVSYSEAGYQEMELNKPREYVKERTHISYDESGRMVSYQDEYSKKYLDSLGGVRNFDDTSVYKEKYKEQTVMFYSSNNSLKGQFVTAHYDVMDHDAKTTKIANVRYRHDDDDDAHSGNFHYTMIFAQNLNVDGISMKKPSLGELERVFKYNNSGGYHDSYIGGGQLKGSVDRQNGVPILHLYHDQVGYGHGQRLRYNKYFSNWSSYGNYHLSNNGNTRFVLMSKQVGKQGATISYRTASYSEFRYNSAGVLISPRRYSFNSQTTSTYNDEGEVLETVTEGFNDFGESTTTTTNYDYDRTGDGVYKTVNSETITETRNGTETTTTVSTYNVNGTGTVNSEYVGFTSDRMHLERTTNDLMSSDGDIISRTGEMTIHGIVGGGSAYLTKKAHLTVDASGNEKTDWYYEHVESLVKPKGGSIWMTVVQVVVTIIVAILTWGAGAFATMTLFEALKQGIMQAVFWQALAVMTVSAAFASIVAQLAFTGKVDWKQVGMTALTTAVSTFVGGVIGSYFSGGSGSTISSTLAETAKAAASISSNLVIAAVQYVVIAVRFVLDMVALAFNHVKEAFSIFKDYAQAVWAGFKSAVISFAKKELAKHTDNKVISFLAGYVLSVLMGSMEDGSGVDYTSQGWETTMSDFTFQAASFGAGELAARSENPYLRSALSGIASGVMAGAKLSSFKSANVNDSVFSAIMDSLEMGASLQGASSIESMIIAGLADEIYEEESYAKTFLVSAASAGGVSLAFRDAKKMFSSNDSSDISEMDATISDDKKTVSINVDKKAEVNSEDGEMTIDDAVSVEDIAQVKEALSFMLAEGAQLESIKYVNGEEGLQIEAQVKVANLKENIKNVLIKDAGLSAKDQVTIVKDFSNNRNYIKFKLGADKLNDFMGEGFKEALDGLVDSSKLNGNIEGRLVLDNKGNIIDRVVVMQINSADLTDSVAKARAQAAQATEVEVEISKKNNNGVLRMTLNTTVDNYLKGLRDNGLGNEADMIEGSLTDKVNNLSDIADLKLEYNIEKVDGQFKTTGLKSMTYKIKSVTNLRANKDIPEGMIAGLKGMDAQNLTLKTTFDDSGNATGTYVAALSTSGDSLAGADLTGIEQADKELGRMLNNLKLKLNNKNIGDLSKVAVNVKNTLNDQGKMFTTLEIVTDISNIKAGSQLYVDLGLSANDSGEIKFAMASHKPNTVLRLDKNLIEDEINLVTAAPLEENEDDRQMMIRSDGSSPNTGPKDINKPTLGKPSGTGTIPSPGVPLPPLNMQSVGTAIAPTAYLYNGRTPETKAMLQNMAAMDRIDVLPPSLKSSGDLNVDAKLGEMKTDIDNTQKRMELSKEKIANLQQAKSFSANAKEIVKSLWKGAVSILNFDLRGLAKNIYNVADVLTGRRNVRLNMEIRKIAKVIFRKELSLGVKVKSLINILKVKNDKNLINTYNIADRLSGNELYIEGDQLIVASDAGNLLFDTDVLEIAERVGESTWALTSGAKYEDKSGNVYDLVYGIVTVDKGKLKLHDVLLEQNGEHYHVNDKEKIIKFDDLRQSFGRQIAGMDNILNNVNRFDFASISANNFRSVYAATVYEQIGKLVNFANYTELRTAMETADIFIRGTKELVSVFDTTYKLERAGFALRSHISSLGTPEKVSGFKYYTDSYSDSVMTLGTYKALPKAFATELGAEVKTKPNLREAADMMMLNLLAPGAGFGVYVTKRLKGAFAKAKQKVDAIRNKRIDDKIDQRSAGIKEFDTKYMEQSIKLKQQLDQTIKSVKFKSPMLDQLSKEVGYMHASSIDTARGFTAETYTVYNKNADTADATYFWTKKGTDTALAISVTVIAGQVMTSSAVLNAVKEVRHLDKAGFALEVFGAAKLGLNAAELSTNHYVDFKTFEVREFKNNRERIAKGFDIAVDLTFMAAGAYFDKVSKSSLNQYSYVDEVTDAKELARIDDLLGESSYVGANTFDDSFVPALKNNVEYSADSVIIADELGGHIPVTKYTRRVQEVAEPQIITNKVEAVSYSPNAENPLTATNVKFRSIEETYNNGVLNDVKTIDETFILGDTGDELTITFGHNENQASMVQGESLRFREGSQRGYYRNDGRLGPDNGDVLEEGISFTNTREYTVKKTDNNGDAGLSDLFGQRKHQTETRETRNTAREASNTAREAGVEFIRGVVQNFNRGNKLITTEKIGSFAADKYDSFTGSRAAPATKSVDRSSMGQVSNANTGGSRRMGQTVDDDKKVLLNDKDVYSFSQN